MARNLVNIGTGPDTQDGDKIRDSFNKLNTMLAELYDRTLVWEEGVSYAIGDLVRDPVTRKLIRCITANTDAIFTAGNWEDFTGGTDGIAVTGDFLPVWPTTGSASQVYRASQDATIGTVRIQTGDLIRLKSANPATPTDKTTFDAEYEFVQNNKVQLYVTRPAAASFDDGELVVDQEGLWQKTTIATVATWSQLFAFNPDTGDPTAVHVDASNEFNTLTTSTPVADDKIIGEKASDGSKFAINMNEVLFDEVLKSRGLNENDIAELIDPVITRDTWFDSGFVKNELGYTLTRAASTLDFEGNEIPANIGRYAPKRSWATRFDSTQVFTEIAGTGKTHAGGYQNGQPFGILIVDNTNEIHFINGPIGGYTTTSTGTLPNYDVMAGTVADRRFIPRNAVIADGLKIMLCEVTNGSGDTRGAGICYTNATDASTAVWTPLEQTTNFEAAGQTHVTQFCLQTVFPYSDTECWVAFTDYHQAPDKEHFVITLVQFTKVANTWSHTGIREMATFQHTGIHGHSAGVTFDKVNDIVEVRYTIGDTTDDNLTALAYVSRTNWLTDPITVRNDYHGTADWSGDAQMFWGWQGTSMAVGPEEGTLLCGSDVDTAVIGKLEAIPAGTHATAVGRISRAYGHADINTNVENFSVIKQNPFDLGSPYVSGWNEADGRKFAYSENGYDWAAFENIAAGQAPKVSWHGDQIIYTSDATVVSYDKPTVVTARGLAVSPGGRNRGYGPTDTPANWTKAANTNTRTNIPRDVTTGKAVWPAAWGSGIMEKQPLGRGPVDHYVFDGSGSEFGRVFYGAANGNVPGGSPPGTCIIGVYPLTQGLRAEIAASSTSAGNIIVQNPFNAEWSYFGVFNSDIRHAGQDRVVLRPYCRDGITLKGEFLLTIVEHTELASISGYPSLTDNADNRANPEMLQSQEEYLGEAWSTRFIFGNLWPTIGVNVGGFAPCITMWVDNNNYLSIGYYEATSLLGVEMTVNGAAETPVTFTQNARNILYRWDDVHKLVVSKLPNGTTEILGQIHGASGETLSIPAVLPSGATTIKHSAFDDSQVYSHLTHKVELSTQELTAAQRSQLLGRR